MFPKTPLDFQHEGRKSRPLRLQIELLDASTKQLFAVLPEDRQFRLPSPLAGKQRGGLRPQPVALEEIVDDAAPQPELQAGLLHTLYTGSRLRGQGPITDSRFRASSQSASAAASQFRHFCTEIPEQLSPELRPGF